MLLAMVKDYVQEFDSDLEPITFKENTTTVEDAANALGVEPAQIAKSILFRAGDKFGLFVAAGDVKVKNGIVKALLGAKPKMASPDEVEAVTGFKVGGVCPFALKTKVPIFLDGSMQRFEKVYTAAGTHNSVLPITFDKLKSITEGTVVDMA